MAVSIDRTYGRIKDLVQQLYPAATPTSDVRGVHRIRSFRVDENGREHFILTFIIDELSSITHRCLEVLEEGDALFIGTTETNPIFQVALSKADIESLRASTPDRSNGSHHVEVARLSEGTLIVKTAGGGGIALHAAVAEPTKRNQQGEFWDAVSELLRVYPNRPARMTSDSPAVRLRAVIDSSLRDLTQFLVPHNYWKTATSVGKGNWADIPWCAVFDTRETESAQKGIYPVMHFLTDPRGAVRMGLGASVTEAGPNAAAEKAFQLIEQLQPDRIQGLRAQGFEVIRGPRDRTTDDYGGAMALSKSVPEPDISKRVSELTRNWRTLLEVYREWADAKYAGGSNVGLEDGPREPSPQEPAPDPFAELVDQTLWDEQELRDVVEGLERAGQIILAGPPGTGKTWVAECLSRFLSSRVPGNELLVQFHPSYSYEDFIDGLRPIMRSGGVVFEPVPGKLVAFVREKHTPGPLVVIVDEMNRANLPRVFGELLYILEYRDRSISLPYSGSFALPRHLRLIGTMNTADRSIRTIDTALRRRFEVFECFPDAEVLRSYYRTRRNDVDGLIEGFERLNATLEDKLDRHHTIGHTFFMADPFSPSLLRSVWKRKILPLLEEYFVDQPDLAVDIKFGTFWPSVSYED